MRRDLEAYLLHEAFDLVLSDVGLAFSDRIAMAASSAL
jgi:hypothetical protein